MKILEKYKNMSVVLKATMWFMVCSFLQKGLSFITTPIFTRLMTQEQYGVYSVYTSWLQILLIFSTLRLDHSVFMKGMSKYSEDKDGYASSMLGLTTAVTTGMFVIYLIFSNQVNSLLELSTPIMLAMFVELYVHNASAFWSIRERFDFRYKSVVIYTLTTAVLSSALSVVAVLLADSKDVARIMANVFVYAVAGIYIYIILVKRGKKLFDKEYIKFAVTFNTPLLLYYFSNYIIEQSDRIMIQKIVSFEAAALYSVAYTVGGLVKIFTAAVTNTLIPLQYRLLEKKDYKSLERNILTVMLCVVGLSVLIAVAGPEIIMILGGEEYMAAIWVVPPVAASVFFSFFYTVLANIEFYYNDNKYAMKLSSVGALINVVLNLIFIPKFGYVAAAYTTLFSYMVYAVGHFIHASNLMRRGGAEHGLNYYLFLFLGVISTTVCILTGYLYHGFVPRIILVLLLGIVAFVKRKYIWSLVRTKAID